MDRKILISIVVFTVLLLGGSTYLLSQTTISPQIETSSNVKVETLERNYDWGEIKYDGEKATKTFKIKNIGTEELKLNNIKTSCTCTTAQISIDGNSSPLFSMHNKSSWMGEVQPGEEADLIVIFDQRFHGPSGVGPIERLISVETNDSQNPMLEFNLKGVVVK